MFRHIDKLSPLSLYTSWFKWSFNPLNHASLVNNIHSFPVVCLRTGTWSLPQRVLKRVSLRASSFSIHYVLVFLSSSSYLLLSSRLSVTSPFLLSFFSITCLRRQFLRKMWPIQLDFLCGRISLSSLAVCNSSTFSPVGRYNRLYSFPAPYMKTFQVFLIYSPKCPSFSSIQSHTPKLAHDQF
jgi:hypothetical protein